MLNYKMIENIDQQIIFIHGNSQSLEYWDLVFNSALKEKYSLIAIDLPGHGNSFKSNQPEKDYSLKGLANHTVQFIRQYENKPYILVGNSLGANIIGEFILQVKNCKGIFLSGSTALGMGMNVSEIVQPNPNVGICFTENFTPEQLKALADDAVCNSSPELKSLIYNTFSGADPRFRSALAQSVSNAEYSDELKNIKDSKLPLALVYGKEEKLCNVSALENLEIEKWKNEIVLIPDSGHCSQLDQPNILSKLILEFANDCFN